MAVFVIFRLTQSTAQWNHSEDDAIFSFAFAAEIGGSRKRKSTEALITDARTSHGSGRMCSGTDCANPVTPGRYYKLGLCVAHGKARVAEDPALEQLKGPGIRKCKVENCAKYSSNLFLTQRLCTHHAIATLPQDQLAPWRCTTDGCSKLIWGNCKALRKCARHGGGYRCTAEDCERRVDSGKYFKMRLCSAHGIARASEESARLQASVVSDAATEDGNAQQRFLCRVDGCNQLMARQGPIKDKCRSHGGGYRCTTEGCDKPVHKHYFRLRLCSAHGNANSKATSSGADRADEESQMEKAKPSVVDAKTNVHRECAVVGCRKYPDTLFVGHSLCVAHAKSNLTKEQLLRFVCTADDCSNYVARQGPRVDRCRLHGGGFRCTKQGCDNTVSGNYYRLRLCDKHGEANSAAESV